MKKIAYLSTLLIIVITPLVVNANEQYTNMCASCHGQSAEGNDQLNAPALAGQQAAYLERQLTNFATGLRGTHENDAYGKSMVAMATAITPLQAREIANYLTGLQATKQASIDGDIKRGAKYYNANCGSCHGGDARGNVALNSPSLRGLDAVSLKHQYGNFVNGARGYQKTDRYGRQMKLIASNLTDQAIVNDIAAYILQLEE